VYLVQLAIHPVESHESHWQAARDGVRLDVRWTPLAVDLACGSAVERSRIEVLSGPRAGDVVEETHELTAWTADRWAALVHASPFAEVASYDGAVAVRPRVPVGTRGRLLWHELRRR
jgi:hypothetical protein